MTTSELQNLLEVNESLLHQLQYYQTDRNC